MSRSGGRRAGRWKRVLFGAALAAILAALAWALLGPSLLVVRSVAVTGAGAVPRAQVLQAAGVRYGTPLIRIDPARIARGVERLTWVQSARVSRHWPDSVVISVRDRVPVLAVAGAGRFQLVDEYGVVLGSAAVRPRVLPLLLPRPVGGLRGSPEVRVAAIVLQDLPARLRARVETVRAASGGVRLRLRGGVRILWGGTDRAAAKAGELALLMRRHALYYDVSDPGSAVTAG